MSKKNLLNEGTIRRFMKLANVEPLTNGFVDRIRETTMGAYAPGTRRGDPRKTARTAFEPGEDKPLEEVGPLVTGLASAAGGALGKMAVPGERDEDVEFEEEEEMVDEPAEPEMDVEVDVDVEPEVQAAVEDIVRQLLDNMEETLEAAGMGDVMDVEGAEAEEDVGLDLEPEAGPPEEELEVGAEEELDVGEEELEEISVVNDERMISEVAKRVTARLVKTLARRNKR